MTEYKCPFFEIIWRVVDGLPSIDAFCSRFRYEDIHRYVGSNEEDYKKFYDLSCNMIVAGDLLYCSRRRAMGDSCLGRLSELNPEPIEKAEMSLREKFHEMERQLEGRNEP